ncbi:MAG: folylpolyglutamate synthase/dihydrofolate synthase family protein [Gemmatimonadaceae bacterium]
MDLALSEYLQALEGLFARTTGASKLGLERTLALLDRLGNPHRSLPVFHVAGTNGKGSVVATVEALLRSQGIRVGKYTSPHLVDFRERLVIDRKAISEADVVAFIDRWAADIESVGATFFEATTAMAFDYFAQSAVDIAVIEVGLGGRLDATNVVRPLASAVVSIGRDHTEYLGETLEAIATEKAGVFKPDVPAIIGEQSPDLRRYLAAAARTAGARPVSVAGDDWDVADIEVGADGTSFTLLGAGRGRGRGRGRGERLHTPLRGRFQALNCATAIALVNAAGGRYRLSAAEVRRALPSVQLAGRFDQRGRFIFDVAHNREGARVLAQTLGVARLPQPLVAVLCVLREKDWQGMMDELAPQVDGFVLTHAPSAPAARTWNLDDAQTYARRRGYDAVSEGSLSEALSEAMRRGATILVTGSFHTVGDAMLCLQADLPTG